ncbi:hypothetical protein CTAYLR_006315 [Chrysophaeum taylorii]|uniref:1-acyl-sn-glycerol-3-phosphate acyltransferase n=1 Tax=Chrysophaeum taylorii TaxID=2483200 RepID=A0AAD7XM09_9STRA|nr:hypothetical protein CTAYLR_006315 [Chrysophaeum taylorii]
MRAIIPLGCVAAFRLAPPLATPPRMRSATSSSSVRAAAAIEEETPAPLEPGFLSLSVGGKSLNGVGVLFGVAMSFWLVAVYPLVIVCGIFSTLFDKKHRRSMDFVVGLWARLSMLTCGYRPRLLNKEELPPRGEGVVYVPNHTSYLDIFTLSGFLPRPVKYVSKIEILRIPFIGWAMGLAGHVALRRTDRRSQLDSYKKAVDALKNGNSLVVFAEGTRSADGRLQTFKRGPFKMAIDAGVDVVPVAIRDLYRWHPRFALMPLARPRGVEIAVLPRIRVANNTPERILEDCYDAVNKALPPHQQGAPSP